MSRHDQPAPLKWITAPLTSIASIRGFTIDEIFGIFGALLVGYTSILVRKIVRPAQPGIRKAFGDRSVANAHVDFVARIPNLKYVIVRATDGLDFVVRSGNVYDYEVASRSYEPEISAVLKPVQGQVMIDVGANIGTHTLRCAKMVVKNGIVIALEPDPESYRLLIANARLNSIHIVALCVAASAHDGLSTLFMSKGTGLHSLARVPRRFDHPMTVRAVAIDSLAKTFDLDVVDWLKIDVEVAEHLFLEGARKTLVRTRNLVLELWEDNRSAVLALLRREGFQTRMLSGKPAYVNILASSTNTGVVP